MFLAKIALLTFLSLESLLGWVGVAGRVEVPRAFVGVGAGGGSGGGDTLNSKEMVTILDDKKKERKDENLTDSEEVCL